MNVLTNFIIGNDFIIYMYIKSFMLYTLKLYSVKHMCVCVLVTQSCPTL